MQNKRDIWVDNVKVLSCILVAVGHFFQSMVKSGIIIDNDLYQWFNQTIYYFHVPLFFISSGYLYQKYSTVNSVRTWWMNISKKAISLGIPYVAFSFITWVLKTVFSGSVNNNQEGLFQTLVLTPTAPYWFLYTLFFIFLLTPTFSNKKGLMAGICIAAALKIVGITGVSLGIYAIDTVISYELWFVFGMTVALLSVDGKICKPTSAVVGIALVGLFLTLSIYVYYYNINFFGIEFLLGLLACGAILFLTVTIFRDRKQNKLLGYMARYTMPIFLMHTIFAAPVRIIMLKLGMESAVVHTAVGLIVSLAGPIAAAEVMKHIKWLDVLLYPNKYITLNYGTFKNEKSDSWQNSI